MIVAAMYGDPVMSAPILPGGSLGEFVMEAGRDGRLSANHPYISAVAVLHRKPQARDWAQDWIPLNRSEYPDPSSLTAALLEAAATDAPGGDDVFLDVVEALSDDAVPLPKAIFNGPLDRRFGAGRTTDEIVQIPLEG